ncbi:hypothetical protein [Conexibacter sp. SYSU D00693]|uniref:hypothetical protein n=1 Tax=Conexibacter sp. SYSU D00693 TaxID=2812560 RepID=UPI00196BB194|nr:hypothetical protein [Conexibacter sp. SYSU D00693]
MTFDRLVRLFLTAPATAPAPSPYAPEASRFAPPSAGDGVPPGMPPFVAVVARAQDAAVAGAAIALALPGSGRDAAVLAVWAPGDRDAPADQGGDLPAAPDDRDHRTPHAEAPPPALLAAPAARRAAKALEARGLPAAARGRLAVLPLPGDVDAAADAAGRAAGLGLPLILALGGPNDPAFAPLLAHADRIVVATPPGASDALTALAVADAARGGRGTGHLVLPPGPGRTVVTSGLTIPPALRRAADAALRGHEGGATRHDGRSR